MNKIKRYILLSLVIPISVGILAKSLFDSYATAVPLYYSAILLAALLLLLALTSHFLENIISPYWVQFNIIGMRGARIDKSLDTRISRFYQNSLEVKIKITRGNGQFLQEDGSFNKCLWGRRGSAPGSRRNIKLLILIPCLKFEQVKKRAITNGQTPANYVETILKLLNKLDNTPNDGGNNIVIRLYDESHVRWRFFIFRTLGNQTALIAPYKSDLPSNKVPMLESRSGNMSFCDSFDGYFNEVFTSASESIAPAQFIANDFANTNNHFTKCADCQEKNTCLELKKKYFPQHVLGHPTQN